ncbi:NAD(+) synthase [Candidatus Bathyarchaeota archaeon]|nr:NAD(+) synthase [Candidatus Bathyarchaeota archaeon]
MRNPSEAIDHIEDFLRAYVKKAAAQGVVVGMSGGLDSSVAAALCGRAFDDSRKVLGLCMPEEETCNRENMRDAEDVAKNFNVEFRVVDVTPMIKAFAGNLEAFDPKNKVAIGNLKARVRAVTLYYYSNTMKRLVVGTTDKSEMMLG